jgi:hypothetical protein
LIRALAVLAVSASAAFALGHTARRRKISTSIYDHPFLGLFQPFFPLVFALDLSRLE